MSAEHPQHYPENVAQVETKEFEGRLVKFLRQKFPLSESGKLLFENIKRAFENKDSHALQELAAQVPTVENPRPELFAELSLSPDEKEKFLGRELANIQITKGCSHGCDFCAVSAEKGIEVMPFPAIVKLALVETDYDRVLKNDFQSFTEAVLRDTGLDVMEFKFYNTAKRITSDQMATIIKCYKEYCGKDHPVDFGLEDQLLKDSPYAYHLRQRILEFIVNKKYLFNRITNYYDSDPFNYKDVFFPHEDGTPADFGDVCKVLARKGRPIHITTAGWMLNDKIAQKAACKIVELHKENPGILRLPRISINPTHKLAQKDLAKYLEMMKNVIRTLQDISPTVVLFQETNKESDYQKVVVKEIIRFITEETNRLVKGNPIEIVEAKISGFSGRAIGSVDTESDHDVMACMPGYHIWPEGSILKQGALPRDSYTGKFIEKGSRPQKVEGVAAFTL